MPGIAGFEYHCKKCGKTTMIPYMMQFKPGADGNKLMCLEWELASLRLRNRIDEIEMCNKLEAEINKLAFDDIPPEITECPQCGK